MRQPTDTPSGIRQIAKHAGVSTASVSRVLNGSAQVSTALRARVMRAVAEHNYRPNAAAKALTTRRTRTVAAVIPTLEHSIFALFMNALEDELAAAGYSLVIATHRFNYQTELRRCNDVLKLGAEAIIVSGKQHDSELEAFMRNAGVPFVFTSVYAPESQTPSYGYDNTDLGYQAIAFLAGLGHRRIAVLHGPLPHNDRMQLRLDGILRAEQTLPGVQVECREAAIGAHAGAEALQHWSQEGTLPDACLCLADVFALGLMLEAHRIGVAIPSDLSLMGFEDLDWAEHCSPRLTTLSLPATPMGKATARALVAHLDHGEPLEHTQFEARIVVRESTARR